MTRWSKSRSRRPARRLPLRRPLQIKRLEERLPPGDVLYWLAGGSWPGFLPPQAAEIAIVDRFPESEPQRHRRRPLSQEPLPSATPVAPAEAFLWEDWIKNRDDHDPASWTRSASSADAGSPGWNAVTIAGEEQGQVPFAIDPQALDAELLDNWLAGERSTSANRVTPSIHVDGLNASEGGHSGGPTGAPTGHAGSAFAAPVAHADDAPAPSMFFGLDSSGTAVPVATGVSPVASSVQVATGETPVPTVQGSSPTATIQQPVDEPAGAESPTRVAAVLSPSRRLGFDRGLEGWTIDIVGGTAEGRGSVTAGSALLREGNSFLVSLEREFLVPPNPSPLIFRYTDLSFDTTDPRSINDAFEATVIDAAGRNLVHVFSPARDAFFNVTEEVGLVLGQGTTHMGDAIKTATVDLSGVLAGTMAKVRFRLVNNDQDTNTSVRILEVRVPGNEPPVVNATPASTSTQYSDPVGPVTITATDDSEGPLTATTATSVNGGAFVAGLPNGVTFNGSGTNGSGRWTLTGLANVAPASYVVRVTIADREGEAASRDIPLTVTREDARATYSGVAFVSTSSASDNDAVVTLRATLQDITAVDAVADPSPGDIRNATVAFVNRDTGATIASGLPVTLITSSDTRTGVASFNWTVNLGGSNSQSFTIGMVAGGYYTRNSSADDTVATVSRPLNNFLTGGGYLLNQSSALAERHVPNRSVVCPSRGRAGFAPAADSWRQHTPPEGVERGARDADGGSVVTLRPPTRHKRDRGSPGPSGPPGRPARTGRSTRANARFSTTPATGPAEPTVPADRRAQPVAGRGPVSGARAGC